MLSESFQGARAVDTSGAVTYLAALQFRPDRPGKVAQNSVKPRAFALDRRLTSTIIIRPETLGLGRFDFLLGCVPAIVVNFVATLNN
jgi:hypothetical protein